MLTTWLFKSHALSGWFSEGNLIDDRSDERRVEFDIELDAVENRSAFVKQTNIICRRQIRYQVVNCAICFALALTMMMQSTIYRSCPYRF